MRNLCSFRKGLCLHMCYIRVQIQSCVCGSSARSGFGPAFSHYACHKTSEVITPHSTMNANKINQWLMKNFILKHQLSLLLFHGYSSINCFHTDLTLFCQKFAPLLFTESVFLHQCFLFPSSWNPGHIIYLHLVCWFDTDWFWWQGGGHRGSFCEKVFTEILFLHQCFLFPSFFLPPAILVPLFILILCLGLR